MMKFQTKPNCQNSPRAFQSNKTLSVQTHEHFQTQSAGQKEIVWECTEGEALGAEGARDTWPLHLHSTLGEGGINNFSLFMKKKWDRQKSVYLVGA